MTPGLFIAADWFAAARTLGNEIDSIMTVKTLVWRKFLVYCPTVNPNLLFRPYKQKRHLWNLQLFYDDIEKEENFFRYKRQFLQVSIFSFLGFAKFTIKTTTELVKFYSLNSENKEHHILRVKMLTKIIMAIFFSVYSVGGKSTYSELIPICLFWGFSGHAPAYVEKKINVENLILRIAISGFLRIK